MEQGAVCAACGASNPSGFRFCGTCGAALERSCPACGAAVLADFRFCGSCGAAMSAGAIAEASSDAGAQAREERKVVTVLFADLAASTELATKLDPEDLHRVFTAYFDAMSGAVEIHGGVVEKFIGDAVVGVFGAPATHDDDPQRAVRSGFAMQAALGELNRELATELDEELALRVGIHTGEVIASPGASGQALVTGDAISIAARLQTVAPLGGIVVSSRTYRDAARSFRFEDLGAMSLKGLPEPVAVWSVVGEAHGGPLDSDHPLVGRADELALLDVLLRRCERDGRPHLATVTGPAGVGKSRLAFEFTNRTRARTVRGRCLPYDGGLRLWPLAEIVKTEAAILDSDPPDAIAAKARDAIGGRFEPGDPGGASLATLLSSIGIPVDPDPLSGVGAEVGRRMILNTWARYVTSVASDRPLVAWIEDLHWADDALLDLLDGLLNRVSGAVLFLCLARPELLERRPAWNAGGGSASVFELSPLSHEESASLVDELLEGPVDPDLSTAIVERAGGNPFFTTELVRTLVEDASIGRHDGTWEASGDITAAMPDTVQTAIAARIDRLPPGEKSVLQKASVVGGTFWTGASDELSGPTVDAAIETLIDRGLIRRRPSSSIAGAAEHVFEHALIREVAYGSIPRSRRPEMHVAVVDWMVRGTRGRDEEFAELIAHHAELAGDHARTARYATLAGHRHRRVYAAEEAIRWYERALTATEGLHEAATLRAEILHSRGEAQEQLGRDEEALRAYEQAAEIARETGREWLEAQELSAIASILRSLERYDEAEAIVPRALASARQAGLEYYEARVTGLAGELAWDRGDAVRARERHDDALRISQESRDLEGEAFARTGLTEVGLCQGPFDRAIADGTRGRQLWLRLGHRPAAAAVAQMLGMLHLLTGGRETAQHLFQEALAGARELGMTREEPMPLTGLALLAIQRGALGEAGRLLDEAVACADETGATRASIAARVARCLLWQELGAPDRARIDLDDLDAHAASASTFLRSVRLAARAWVEIAEGNRDQAMATFQRARSQAEGLLLPRIGCARFEILAWHDAGEGSAARDSARWLLGGPVAGSPIAAELGAWARDDAEVEEPSDRRDADPIRPAEDVTLEWRALVRSATAASARGDLVAVDERLERAQRIVESISGSIDDEMRIRFRTRPEVAALVGGMPPPALS